MKVGWPKGEGHFRYFLVFSRLDTTFEAKSLVEQLNC